ncbi:hypothetical protein BpHYR1_020723 [Brachionus plicatilis]|uniref:Uncharacterized protein n=1 Tax=Brachionus plicatilis TaxID=10195 RepID=A0A3M7QIT3_BRAPC|nr:hypothetical protein BpHYR1_020723 [Brachionus plicatilis]
MLSPFGATQISFSKSRLLTNLSGKNKLPHATLKLPSFPIDSTLLRQVVKQLLCAMITLGYND